MSTASRSYILAPARAVDVNDIAELEADSFPPDEAASPETIAFRLRCAGLYFYTFRAECDTGELVGFINGTCVANDSLDHDCMTNHDPAGRVLVIHSVTIKSSYRRKGLATKMLKEYIQRMTRENSIDKLMLLSKAVMLPLYLASGFQVMRLSSVEHGKDKWFEMELNLQDLRSAEQLQVDAFTPVPFAGNPAAVVFEHRDDEWMQNVAMENNYAETSFLEVVPDAEVATYKLRWFTPAVEVELCGHATLAAAHALYETRRVPALQPIRFETKYSGTLTAVGQADGSIELNFPATPVFPVELGPELRASLREALSLADAEVLNIGKSLYDLVVEVSREAFARLATTKIDFAKICEQGGRCVLVTCLGRAHATQAVNLAGLPPCPPRTPQAAVVNDPRFDFLSRAFVPRYGIDEDPVTGSAHCALAPYWTERVAANASVAAGGGPVTLLGYQASARGGEVRVTVDGDRVRLAGHAVTTARCRVVV